MKDLITRLSKLSVVYFSPYTWVEGEAEEAMDIQDRYEKGREMVEDEAENWEEEHGDYIDRLYFEHRGKKYVWEENYSTQDTQIEVEVSEKEV